jgi:serine/threonine protein phosphatase PrpC
MWNELCSFSGERLWRKKSMNTSPLFSSPEVLVSVFAQTDVGMARKANEDAFLIADLNTGKAGMSADVSTYRVGERGSLMIVSDGMGGHRAGEVASMLASSTMLEALMKLPHDMDPLERLGEATRVTNEVVWNYAAEHPELAGMGTTLTAVLVEGPMAYISQVGDSRAYLLRGENIQQLTKDQSLIQLLLDSGRIKPEEADKYPNHVITQAIGAEPQLRLALKQLALKRDDYLLICSDGLTNKVSDEEMLRVVKASVSLDVACRRLVNLANDRGGEDNITVIIARFDGEALDSRSGSLNSSSQRRAS